MTEQRIGQYQILAELGAGGMGIVYRALDTEIQREVALKRLRSEFAASPAVLERFRNEAKLQGRLNHPNIAQLYSVVQTPNAFCIVMEFVDGVVVKDLLPLRWELAAATLLQVLDALELAHNSGVLHRDIKPENIIVNRLGMVKVMDFGIAHAVGSQRMTREKSLIGTIEYMSPERILGKPMDCRSDIYALGILFFEFLTGRLPFEISNEYDLLRWQVEGRAPAVASVAAVPEYLDIVIQRAMQKEPNQRYSSCCEMAAELRALIPGLTTSQDGLRDVVAAHAKATQTELFDAMRCYTRVKQCIDAGDLGSAERTLRAELNRHPREASLRNYHEVVSQAQPRVVLDEDGAGGDERQREEILGWLRLIAAARVSDHAAYGTELQHLCARSSDSALAQILLAREQEF
jgi:tRNA A-37 threonylcarbamoyl transferase component Bud32